MTGMIANEPNQASVFICKPLVNDHSHFNLFINWRREVELGQGLPFF